MKFKRIAALLLALLMSFSLLTGCAEEDVELAGSIVNEIIDIALSTDEAEEAPQTQEPVIETAEPAGQTVAEDGEYSTKDEVALYIHLYGHLPSNFITKKDAKAAGWEGGSLDEFFVGKSIGGDRFGNYEKILPVSEGRTWKECDINTAHSKSRGAERIVFSNDGLIYYTSDHYETFEQLY